MSNNKESINDSVPLPPKDAEVFTTACDYCITGCGYKVYRWPVGKDGDINKEGNAFNSDFPTPILSGVWVSPNQHNVVSVDGKDHNVIVIADHDAKVVNVGGDHSIRGGTIAKKVYNPNTPTKDRLKYPMIRINGKLERVSWDVAIEVMAEVSKYVIENRGRSAWAMKMFSYQYWENTHALTKLALRKIRTPAWAVHDQPTGHGPDTPGMADAGIDNFSASYEDWSTAEVLFISGTDPFETKTIIYNEWILKGIRERGMKVISVLPRKTAGAAYAEKMGGLYLEINPGTDTILHYALSRIIMENDWQDAEFVDKWINNRAESDIEVFHADGFSDYKDWILSYKYSDLDLAAEMTGIPKEKIIKAAEWMAKPNADGSRPKTSIGFEKGLYWSNNYLNTATITSLGLICGAGNRPGQVISRFGGHQRGMMPGGQYPEHDAPGKFPGWKKHGIDVDQWVEDGRASFAWVIGTTWTHAMTASSHLEKVLRRMTSDHSQQPQRLDMEHIISTFKKRVDEDGMVMVNQDIYPIKPIGTELADIVLPAATWGEEDLTRANGERRIRLYQKFYDAPGEALPDWKIAAKFAKKMGFSGFDWETSNDVFENAAFYNKGRRTSYVALVEYARAHNKTGHELLAELGTEGIQAPVRWEDGKLVGTKRLHDSTLKTGVSNGLTAIDFRWLRKFKTSTGRANLLKAPWELFADYWEFMKPKDDELWVTTGRINEFWQSGFDDQVRRPYLRARWPDNWLEIHPEDAKARGIESGDQLLVWHDQIPVEVGGYTHSEKDTKVRGVVPLYANADIDQPDPLETLLNTDANQYDDSIRNLDRGHAELEEPDPLLQSMGEQLGSSESDPKEGNRDLPLNQQNELEDPIMKSVESAIGMSWNDVKPMTFTEMQKNGYIEMDSASFEAVAIVTDAVKQGVAFTYFNLPSARKGSPNSLAGRVLDPVSQRPRFKLSRGNVKKVGESPFKDSFTEMTFKPRTIV